ncbi:hypothetical protein ACIX9V_004381 [Vibrio vulnificus]|nr:hypothetical protein [Vibrio vulnificus]EIF8196566.1 hypothetical protein [Vibrio vulnificus]ELE7275852.1 hypothetical protein [Vibrio vulnificus]
MNKITNLQQISSLPIPAILQEQIQSILTEPFHDEVETQQAWDELQCELWFLTSISDLSADGVDGTGLVLLERALTYTEFEDELEPDMVLTLSIIEDNGKGIYLLMPKILLTELRQHFSIGNE